MAFRIGIIGTGKIAAMHARAMAMSPEVEAGGVASRSEASAQAFAAEHGIPFATDSTAALFARDEIDGIYVATPTGPKEELALAALAAGKHVLVEKPLASAASAEGLAKTAREAGRLILDATHFTHNARTHALRSAIPEELGRPLTLNASFHADVGGPGNIRYDSALEPQGALGDLGWYVARAVVEILRPEGLLVRTSAHGTWHGDALIAASGFWVFESGERASFDCGFEPGAMVQDLTLVGRSGIITMDDFVHDWEKGRIDVPCPDIPAGYAVRQGRITRDTIEYRQTPAPRSHVLELLAAFASWSDDPMGAQSTAAQERMIATQRLVDAAYAAASEAR
ncbi:MAG: Gfo/Idh/MocA family oxidoreductase [Pseudomonadota bacterium]